MAAFDSRQIRVKTFLPIVAGPRRDRRIGVRTKSWLTDPTIRWDTLTTCLCRRRKAGSNWAITLTEAANIDVKLAMVTACGPARGHQVNSSRADPAVQPRFRVRASTSEQHRHTECLMTNEANSSSYPMGKGTAFATRLPVGPPGQGVQIRDLPESRRKSGRCEEHPRHSAPVRGRRDGR